MIPKAIIFDLDDTLSESKVPITSDMAKLIAELLNKTILAVITGEKLEQLHHQVTEELPPSAELRNLYLFPTSGAEMFAYHDQAWAKVYEEDLDPKEIDRIETAIEQGAIDSGVIDFSLPSYGERIETRGTQVTISALGQEAPIAEKRRWDPTSEKKRKLQEAIKVLLPDFDVKIGGATSIDVTKPGIDKAYGVQQLAKELHVPLSAMLYVGDRLTQGGNDEVITKIDIPTHAVKGPLDTASFIKTLLDEIPVSTVLEIRDDKVITKDITTTDTQSNISNELEEKIRSAIKGDVTDAESEIEKYSRDTSLFKIKPSLVVYPKDTQDVVALVKTVRAAKDAGQSVSLTGRSAGTDMSGGPLTNSIVTVFLKYMNRIISINKETDRKSDTVPHVITHGSAVAEPGVFYRDFEKQTLARGNLVLPSYPASRELCAIGGIVNNNSGGERTLEYGKTEDYIEEIEVVLSDGTLTTFKDLDPAGLEEKKRQRDFEGEIYRKMHALITENAEVIQNARPKVSKNSAGYALWNVIHSGKGTFNLARLICGAQGTLALMTKAKLRLVKEESHRAMLVIFLKDLRILPEIVHRVLPFNPESFESYDDQTFKLAIRFMPQMLSQMGFNRALRLGLSFIPETAMVISGGVPKLILMAEFSADTPTEALQRAQEAHDALRDMGLQMSIKKNERESEKYWIVRRESFALLRKNVHGLYASPFIDDFVVPPDTYPQFLPELDMLLAEYSDRFIYTVAGHIGNGNFHIIPLMDLTKPSVRQVVIDLAPKVYALVIKYGGTTTGEHNDGIIRTPYLPMLFGDKMVALFEETKSIFDPSGIFNPGKKVHGTFSDIKHDMLKTV